MRSLFHQIFNEIFARRVYVGERALMRNDRNTCWFRGSSTSPNVQTFFGLKFAWICRSSRWKLDHVRNNDQ